MPMESDIDANQTADDAKAAEEKQSSAYFADYSNIGVHKMMLLDNVRMEAYFNAIVGQSKYFKDKVVMDVGCGTGILSLFCAKAGAKKVYAVDASYISTVAQEVVNENNLQDVVEVIHSAVENLDIGDTKVDIIVSEWMGFYLLHEGMLDSVIAARDKFLKEDGKLFPEYAYLYIACCSVPSFFDQFDDFYGFKMSAFSNKLLKSKRPEVTMVKEEELMTPEVEITSFNLKTVTTKDLDEIHFEKVIPASRDGNCQGLCIWWKCVFPNSLGEGSQPVVLTTSPRDPETHWKQCMLVLPYSNEVEVDEPIGFNVTLYRSEDNKRNYKIEFGMLDTDEMEHPTPCDCYNTKCILVKAFLAQVGNGVKEVMEDDDMTEEQDTETNNGNM